MATQKESEKRDFIDKMIDTVTNSAQRLIDKGYDPANRIEGLQNDAAEVDAAEMREQDAIVAQRNATREANLALDKAYANASEMVEVLSGMLGKKDSLVLELRKLRK